jgi:hypothetical protein
MPTFSNTGPVWVVGLDHQECNDVEGVLGTVAGLVAATPTVSVVVAGIVVVHPPAAAYAAAVGAALGAAAAYIFTMDVIGGEQGVDVNGVVGVPGVIVTPQSSGMFGTLVQAARVAATGITLVEFILKASSQTPTLANALGIQVAANVFSGIEAGSPLGWALAAGAGLVVNLFESAPDPNEHGGVHADRNAVGDWERFIMVQIPPGIQIALMSWQGLFSAQGGGGGDVYANRAQVGQWETWALMRNQDRKVSFQSTDGHFLTALNGGGGGSFCLCDRTAIGSWEEFYLENLPGGHIAVKTHDKNTYLSVQSGK